MPTVLKEAKTKGQVEVHISGDYGHMKTHFKTWRTWRNHSKDWFSPDRKPFTMCFSCGLLEIRQVLKWVLMWP